MFFPRTRAHSGSLLLVSRVAAVACLVSGLGLLLVDQSRSGAAQAPLAGGSFRLNATVAVNNGLGTDVTSTDFALSVLRSGDEDGLSVPGDGTATDLVTGTYALHSTGLPNYEISDWTCVDDLSATVLVENGTFTANDGQRIACRAEQRLIRLSTRITAVPAEADPGDTVTISITIHNTGGAGFRAARAVSPQCDADPKGPVVDHGNDAVMETGEEWDFVCTHLVTATDPSPLLVQAWSGVHTAARRELEGEATRSIERRAPTTTSTTSTTSSTTTVAAAVTSTVASTVATTLPTVAETPVVNTPAAPATIPPAVVPTSTSVRPAEALVSTTNAPAPSAAPSSPLAPPVSVLGEQVVAGPAPAESVPAGLSVTPPATLAFAGAPDRDLTVVAAVLMAAGLALVVAARPRRRPTN